VDYSSAPLDEHLLNLVFHTQPGSFEIHTHRGIPIRLGQFAHSTSCPLVTGVVESNIKASIASDDLLKQPSHIGFNRDIGLEKTGIDPLSLEQSHDLLPFVGSTTRDDRSSSFTSKGKGSSLSNASTPTSDKHNLVSKSLHLSTLSYRIGFTGVLRSLCASKFSCSFLTTMEAAQGFC